jgi:hypothetical protein
MFPWPMLETTLPFVNMGVLKFVCSFLVLTPNSYIREQGHSYILKDYDNMRQSGLTQFDSTLDQVRLCWRGPVEFYWTEPFLR